MNLSDFTLKFLNKNLFKNEFLSNFISELNDALENRSILKNKYSEYWNSQKFMEDNVSAKIGISKYSSNISYNDEIRKVIDNSILQLSEKEGTIYRKKFSTNGSANGEVYNIEQFKDGNITKLKIPKEIIPKEFQNEDIIFKFNENRKIELRNDLKEKAVELASENLKYLKQKETKRNDEYKKEGHLYEAFEDDGYIFLNDITEKRNFCIEDIDFIVDNYKGEGKYKVIDGEYKEAF